MYTAVRPTARSASLLRHGSLAVAHARPTGSAAPRAASALPAQKRHSSHSPLGASPKPDRKKVTVQTIDALYRRNEPITMITAHDFPSAHLADHAGMDIVLVGDSLAMVALGMEDTSEVLEDEMLLHCRSVSRGAKTSLIIGDLPMGSYEISPDQALATAIRFVKQGRVHGIKLEGGQEIAPTIKRITDAGIPTIGIGAGNGCSGQVLVQVDMMGNFPPGRFLPKFVKKYGDIWGEGMRALQTYRDEVKTRAYPAKEHTYPISKEALGEFEQALADEKSPP